MDKHDGSPRRYPDDQAGEPLIEAGGEITPVDEIEAERGGEEADDGCDRVSAGPPAQGLGAERAGVDIEDVGGHGTVQHQEEDRYRQDTIGVDDQLARIGCLRNRRKDGAEHAKPDHRYELTERAGEIEPRRTDVPRHEA